MPFIPKLITCRANLCFQLYGYASRIILSESAVSLSGLIPEFISIGFRYVEVTASSFFPSADVQHSPAAYQSSASPALSVLVLGHGLSRSTRDSCCTNAQFWSVISCQGFWIPWANFLWSDGRCSVVVCVCVFYKSLCTPLCQRWDHCSPGCRAKLMKVWVLPALIITQ